MCICAFFLSKNYTTTQPSDSLCERINKNNIKSLGYVSSVFLPFQYGNNRSLKENFNWAKKYNSDIHWANTFLGKRKSIRTPFFKYSSIQENAKSRKREKVFTYLKNFEDRSPVRIEFDFRQYAC